MLRLIYRMLLMIACVALMVSACKKDPEEPEEPEELVLEYSTSEYCENSCYFANDGECDDGGYGSSSSYCNFGTDCLDCGIRIKKTIKR
jgi:hypothetical protein